VGSSSQELQLISADQPDWARENYEGFSWYPSRPLIRAVRDYQAARNAPGPLARLRAKLAVVRHRFWSAVTGADIPINCQLGGGLVLPHPNGVVIHPDAVVGPNCLLFQQVTIGTGSIPGVPTLGGHVEVGAGAKLLGGIHIGDHAKIAANSVVLCDVPSGALMAGIPAVVKRC
jgi:serine O-acetyltransferase